MNNDRVDPSLGRVHLHTGPFSRSNTINLRNQMNQVYKLAEQEHYETGRPLSECGRDHAHEIILDYLNRVYPRENGQWIHRPNCGWYFENENSNNLNNSWSSSREIVNVTNSRNLKDPQNEEEYLRSIKPSRVLLNQQTNSYAKNRMMSHKLSKNLKKKNDLLNDYEEDYLSEDLNDLNKSEKSQENDFGQNDGIPSSAIQAMFQKMFS